MNPRAPDPATLATLWLVVAAAALFTVSAHATEPAWQTAQSLRVAAESLARTQLAAPGETLAVNATVDDAMRLPACAQPLATRVHQQNNSALTAALSCEAPTAWTIYVVVRVSRQAQVMVLNRPLLAGETVTADAVSQRTREVADLPYGFLAQADTAVGQTARHALAAGAVLAPSDLVPLRIVRRGQPVTLVGHAEGLTVRADGQAMADGAAGDYIQVRNLRSQRLVRGRIRSGQEVEVDL